MPQNNINSYTSDDIKLTDVVRSFRGYSVFIFKKMYIVFIGLILFGVLGFFYAKLSQTKYQANASFNVVDSKGLGSIGGLLSSFGLASFGGSTSNEVMAGLMQSRNTIKSAFLSEVLYKGDSTKLIDIYLEEYGIREDWAKDAPELVGFEFTANNVYKLSRKEDSLLNIFWRPFVEDYLNVEFEILEGLVKAEVKTYSYDFSKGMLAEMLDLSSRYFTDKQVKGKVGASDVAQYRVDSLSGLLESKRAQFGREQNKATFMVDASESVAMSKLGSEIGNLSIRLAAAKETLDATKTSLMQEAPVINIIDHPYFAMDIKQKKWKLWTLIGAIVGAALSILILLFVKAVNDGFEEEEELLEQEIEIE